MRNVIVTGANRGLGLSLTQKFLAKGDRVFAVSRTKSGMQEAARVLGAGGNWIPFICDLASPGQVRRLIYRIAKKAGRIDILINNAGYGGGLGRIEDVSVRELERHLAVNLKAAFFACKYAVPFFLAQKSGLIINVSSMAGKRAVPRLFPYSAAKFGVLALSQCVAKENEGTGLKCVTVCPGGMNTRMRSDIFGLEDAARQQSADFVADVMLKVIGDEIHVESGGDIVIRHGQVSAVNPPPAA